MTFQLNDEQQVAVERMLQHLNTFDNQPFLVLKAPAGCGKTTTQSHVLANTSRRMVCTAPTNKAVKVMAEMLPPESESCTIYKLLGLRLMANGEVKRIAGPADTVDLSYYEGVIVDEASMLNSTVMGHIRTASNTNPHIRWIFMGDQYQLPPVLETTSEIWSETNVIELTKVMRTDNQILTLATNIRSIIAQGSSGVLSIKSDYDERGGVFADTDFLGKLHEDAEACRAGTSKAISWRNETVNKLNAHVRKALLPNWQESTWLPGERVTLLEPAKSLNDETVGTTDEEFTIDSVDVINHPMFGYLTVYALEVSADFDGRNETLFALHESSQAEFDKRCKNLAEEAKKDSWKWRVFWGFKESVHQVRHAYAQTAHRSQGSTYSKAYVSWRDIMLNRRREEALRCLYVAVSRPRHSLYLS